MDLTGKFLIAMPALADPRFARSVVLICHHNQSGAMGLIVNRPLPDLTFAALLQQLDLTPEPEAPALPVHFGGPVETGRGFVLHSDDWRDAETTLQVPLAKGAAVGLSGTLEVLRAIAAAQGPAQALLALGYAGWSAGQLEGEIRRNDWLVADAAAHLLFDTPAPARWEGALRLIGIDAQLLSATAGNA